ncbi:MAG TPA: ATP-binding protein [Bacteroidales bacterium]|nr:ATP-binding protein [Bacteroidales bacterium]
MWQLDMRTILFGFLTCDLVSTMVMIALYVQNGRRFKGGIFWITNFTLQTISMALIILRGTVPDWISIVLSNTFLITGIFLGLISLEKFVGIKRNHVLNYALIAVFICISYWASMIKPDLEIRTINIAMAMLILCFQCSWILLCRTSKELRRITFGVGIIFAVYCIVNVFRIIAFLMKDIETNNFFESGQIESIVIISYQVLFLLLTYSIILMVNKKLKSDVELEDSERRKAEERLYESNRKLETLINNLNGVVYRCLKDTGYTMEYISDGVADLTGFNSQEFIQNRSRTFNSIIHADDQAMVWDSIRASIKNKTPYTIEYRIITASGEEKWVWEKGRAVWDENEVVALEGFISDITIRKKAENEVKLLNSELESRVIRRTKDLEEKTTDLEGFCYSVSHDLRAPLRAINGYSSIFLNKYSESVDEQGKSILKNVIESTIQMDNLINDLLSLSRIGRKEIVSNVLDMRTITESVINGLYGKDEIKNLTFELKDIQKCKGDPSMITHVIYNLVENAVKYSSKSEQPRIEISSSHLGSEVVYHIKDNGIGFDQQYADRLFNVFQRLHTEEEFAGTGVGLAIVKRIIQRMGGRVWAEGKVNEGATFYFSLPAISA